MGLYIDKDEGVWFQSLKSGLEGLYIVKPSENEEVRPIKIEILKERCAGDNNLYVLCHGNRIKEG